MAAAFEQVEETRDVTFYIDLRVYETIAHPGLGGEVHNDIKGALLENVGHRFFICQGSDGAVKAAMDLKLCKPCLFQAQIIVIVKIVDRRYPIASL